MKKKVVNIVLIILVIVVLAIIMFRLNKNNTTVESKTDKQENINHKETMPKVSDNPDKTEGNLSKEDFIKYNSVTSLVYNGKIEKLGKLPEGNCYISFVDFLNEGGQMVYEPNDTNSEKTITEEGYESYHVIQPDIEFNAEKEGYYPYLITLFVPKDASLDLDALTLTNHIANKTYQVDKSLSEKRGENGDYGEWLIGFKIPYEETVEDSSLDATVHFTVGEETFNKPIKTKESSE